MPAHQYASAFLFPMLLGFASALGKNASFGTLALLGLVPCVVLQTIGVIFALKTHSIRIFVPVSFRRRRAFSGVDKYSEIDELENENQELKEMLEKKMATQSDFDTQAQAMNDLVEIYKLIEDNKIAAAKEKFRKIETMGFDDSALALYGAIEKILLK